MTKTDYNPFNMVQLFGSLVLVFFFIFSLFNYVQAYYIGHQLYLSTNNFAALTAQSKYEHALKFSWTWVEEKQRIFDIFHCDIKISNLNGLIQQGEGWQSIKTHLLLLPDDAYLFIF